MPMASAARRASMPTGAVDAAASLVRGAARGVTAREQSPRRRKTSFGGTSRREMRLELMGEDTPGPGAYLPASTFARAASSSYSSSYSSSNSKLKGRRVPTTTSSFRSTSAQRAGVHNQTVPGPGAHSPNKRAIEKNMTNAAPYMIAKGQRFSGLGSSDWDHAKSEGRPEPGPGAYETHRFSTMAMDTAQAVAMGSRQNPGFGIASAQHQLPHEQAVSQDAEYPGPGKYETNTSEISRADGHKSVFKPPIERKKGFNNQNHRGGGQTKGNSSGRKGRGKPGKAETVHV